MAGRKNSGKTPAPKRHNITLQTREPVNERALVNLASRKAAGSVCWPGWEVGMRTVIHAFLACVQSGQLQVTWSEGRMTEEVGFKTRRFFG